MKPTLAPDQRDQALVLWLQNYDTCDIAKILDVEESAVFNEIFFPDARPASERTNVLQFRRRAS